MLLAVQAWATPVPVKSMSDVDKQLMELDGEIRRRSLNNGGTATQAVKFSSSVQVSGGTVLDGGLRVNGNATISGEVTFLSSVSIVTPVILYSTQAQVVTSTISAMNPSGVYMASATIFAAGITFASTVSSVTVAGTVTVNPLAADANALLVTSQTTTTHALWVDRYGFIGSTTQPNLRYTLASAVSINSAANTIIKFDTKQYDTQSMYAVSHATIPTGGAGFWNVKCFAGFATNSSGRRYVAIRVNDVALNECSDAKMGISDDETKVNISCRLQLSAGDSLSCLVFQNAGSSINLNRAFIEVGKGI